MQRDELIKTLLDIDEECFLCLGEIKPKPRVVIVGGAAFILHGLTQRKATYDVDIYEADKTISKILSLYPEISGSVAAYNDQIPYNFEDRLIDLDIKTNLIDYVTPSVEDLVVMKLYAQRGYRRSY